MARGSLMRLIQRVARKARMESGTTVDTTSNRSQSVSYTRRTFLKQGLGLGLGATLPAALRFAPALGAGQPRIVVVGGGLAGLAATYELRKAGIKANLFEATPRIGGRCWTERRVFDQGQIAERGGELIDTEHHEIRALAAELGLELDDLLEAETPGSEAIFVFADGPYSMRDATADFQRLLPALEADARVLRDNLPTFRSFTPAQRALDRMATDKWIESRVRGGLESRLGRLLANAYIEELGADIYEISAVTVVTLLKASPRERFSPYEESDQRYHIRGGNDQIARALAEPLGDQITTSQRLLAATRLPNGRYRLTFARDQATRDETADYVIFALPFTLLRQIDLERAAFRARKLKAIRELGMGRNTKLQLQFGERYWRHLKANGETRIEGAYETSWDVTRAQPGAAGILNCYSGGSTATRAGEGEPEECARQALNDLERVMPGISAFWNGRVIRNAWDRYPWSLGSYSLMKPGQYTTLNGILDKPQGSAHFAGEHTSEAWPGYMNGAVESGQRAAREVLAALRITGRQISRE